MCGIAGIISPYAPLVTLQQVQLMINTLQHRGPNGEGQWQSDDNTVAFGHRRLSIIDLSNNAAQPLHYLHYTIIFNGEIYNYIELKNELQQQGYTFSTNSDTEVIPAAYDCWGKDCYHHFDGMFAFAIYNNNTKEVFIARDRFGEKPLYYHAQYQQRGKFERFVFASEMKALWALGVPKDLNGTMALNYITLGYLQNPIKKTQTFYSHILSLPPGHCLSIQPTLGKVQMKRWYKTENSEQQIVKGEKETIEKFADLFATSVNRRLRSDVAVGTSLSGGLDSSSIVAAIMQLQTSNPIAIRSNLQTFSAIFPGFEKDESAYSKIVVDQFHLQQHTVTPTENDWIEHWQKLMYHQEEPLQSSSVFTQFMVYKLAKEKGVTVLLDGQGADEILGGYKKYTHWFLQALLKKDYSSFKREKQLLQQHQFLESWGIKNYAAAYLPEKTAKKLQQKAINQQLHHAHLNQDFYTKYYNDDTLQKPVIHTLEDMLRYNTFTIGLEELLRYADRNSMAHGREVRLPFLSHQLVEFIFSLPSSYKIQNGFTKWVLRQSMVNTLPDSIVWRTNKIGYEPPQQQWLQDKTIQGMVRDSKKILVEKNVLQPSVLKQAIQPQAAHSANNFDWRYLCAAELFTK
ncbi:asparagine synthase (glutamine-hydrolyzing) [Parasediminibacterium paludis]|uniref:asparagine synthase (glutamine-hydrolyzing) n=1 Tax=Parasediminibacterium paludis TaxID=908966 RepID=A0ABV8PSC7_9BACT